MLISNITNKGLQEDDLFQLSSGDAHFFIESFSFEFPTIAAVIYPEWFERPITLKIIFSRCGHSRENDEEIIEHREWHMKHRKEQQKKHLEEQTARQAVLDRIARDRREAAKRVREGHSTDQNCNLTRAIKIISQIQNGSFARAFSIVFMQKCITHLKLKKKLKIFFLYIVFETKKEIEDLKFYIIQLCFVKFCNFQFQFGKIGPEGDSGDEAILDDLVVAEKERDHGKSSHKKDHGKSSHKHDRHKGIFIIFLDNLFIAFSTLNYYHNLQNDNISKGTDFNICSICS